MGRSAKLHKRVVRLNFYQILPVLTEQRQSKKLKSKLSSSNDSSTQDTHSSMHSQFKAQNAKKRADLRAKAKNMSSASGQKEGGVLGDADYVSLLMGGRRKAKGEAEKLPQDDV